MPDTFPGGIFRPDPQPTQRIPYAPIPAQGQQPPRIPPLGTVNSQIIRTAWEPPPPEPAQRPLNILPVTLTYGQQPVPTSDVVEFETVQTWNPPDPQPTQKLLNVVPLTFIYGQQPPRLSTILLDELVMLWKEPDPQPTQRYALFPIVPQGQQPPLRQQFIGPYTLWVLPDLLPYEPVESAAIIPQVQITQVPYTTSLVPQLTWLPIDYLIPRLLNVPIPVQGQQPPRWSFVTFNEIGTAWVPPDPLPVQHSPTVPIPPPITNQPIPTTTVLLDELIGTWNPPDPQPTQRPPFVPIPQQGQQPPRYVTVILNEIVGSWLSPDPQVTQRQTTLPIKAQGQQPQPTSTVLYNELIGLWKEPDPPPTQVYAKFPTTPQGQQPPISYPAILYEEVGAWKEPDPQPVQKLLNIAPLMLRYGIQIPYNRQQYTPQDDYQYRQSRSGIATVLVTPISPNVAYSTVAVFTAIWQSWLPADQQQVQHTLIVLGSTVILPDPGDVRFGVFYDATHLPAPKDVEVGIVYG